MKNTPYQKGHECSICGVHLDSSESYTMKITPRGKELIFCTKCDVDLHVPQKPYYKEE